MSAIKQLYVEANEAFYKWEKARYGDNSPLSDHDREMWITGYFMAMAKPDNLTGGQNV